MRTKTVEHIVKSSIVYGYAVTQPFLLYGHSASTAADVPQQSTIWKDNSKIVRHIQEHSSDEKKLEITAPYSLLKGEVEKGIQSSRQIKVKGQKDKQNMKENLIDEKREHFKKVESQLTAIDYGESSERVEEVQEALAFYDYYEGEMDGIYGPLTEAALQDADKEKVLPQSTQPEEKSPTSEEKDDSSNSDSEKKGDGDAQDKQEETSNAMSLDVEGSTDIIQQAKDLIGTPYVWGGTSPSGFDCSGFIQFVYEEEDKTLPRTVREIWNYGDLVDKPSIGDLVFFETYQAGPSHMGIYLGNGDFIHAGTSSGVTISNYKDTDYWQERYIGAKRID